MNCFEARIGLLAFFASMLVGFILLAHAEGSFGVTMKVKDVNSNSPTVKAIVKTDTGLKISKTVDLGHKADKADWDEIVLHFFFKSDSKAKVGTDFKACLGDQCKSGTNGPEHKPEVVTFSVGD